MKENPSILAAGIFTKLLYAGNASLVFVFFFAESFNNVKVKKDKSFDYTTYCSFEIESYSRDAGLFRTFLSIHNHSLR